MTGLEQWVWIRQGEARVLAFTYVDPTAGPSARGGELPASATPADAQAVAARPGATFRLTDDWPPRAPLGADEIAALGLPPRPPWLAPAPSWRRDPRLGGLLHPDFPDDVQAQFVFEAERRIERMWVRLTGEAPAQRGYRGRLLNRAHSPSAPPEGAEVVIRPLAAGREPFWWGPTAERNRTAWQVACSSCGLDAHPHPLEEIAAAQFPSVPPGVSLRSFTTRCPSCAGAMTVTARDAG